MDYKFTDTKTLSAENLLRLAVVEGIECHFEAKNQMDVGPLEPFDHGAQVGLIIDGRRFVVRVEPNDD